MKSKNKVVKKAKKTKVSTKGTGYSFGKSTVTMADGSVIQIFPKSDKKKTKVKKARK